MYLPPAVTLKILHFVNECIHVVYTALEKIPIISINSINRLTVLTQSVLCCVFCTRILSGVKAKFCVRVKYRRISLSKVLNK